MKYQILALLVFALMLSACFEMERKSEGAPTGDVPTVNTKPTILGSPPTSVRVGEDYSFTPSAQDPDGDALTFGISNSPSWASFDTTSGRLSGRPQQGDTGVAANVRISVSDGKDHARLGRFSVTVNQISLGSTILSWMPPSQNTNGSTLTNLAGYRIYYGRRADTLNQVITISNSGLTSYVIENLSPARWYFSMTSINSRGIESSRSATASTLIT